MDDYVCPGCGDTDYDNLIKLHHVTPTIKLDYDSEDIVLYACKKCSCVQVKNWKFNHKDKPNV